MKIFVRNDNRLYNITKRQKAFLCIMTDYKEVTKQLLKGYKSYKVVISISLWALGGYRSGKSGSMSSVALYASVYV